MSENATDTFWSTTSTATPVSRRVAWRFGGRLGELQLTIAPDQPVTALARMGDGALREATINGKHLHRNRPVAPALVFAAIKEVGGKAVAASATIDLPVISLGSPPPAVTELTIAAQMAAAKATLPTAMVAAGDHAVGWLVKDEVVRFYPLLAVNAPEEVADFEHGAATTSDIIPLLPFQG